MMPHSTPSVKTTALYPGVKTVQPLPDYRLVVCFDNGDKRVFDAAPLLQIGRFRELASQEAFEQVRVVFDTVEWSNGLDLDPEYLHEHSEPYHTE
jgi:hypothetical protein